MKERWMSAVREYGKLVLVCFLLSVSFSSVLHIYTYLKSSQLIVSFLDIGQGDAILVQTPSGHTMLIDGGPNDSVLTQLGKKIGYFDHDIDVIVATHPDADHVTGLIPVLAHYNVEHIVTSGAVSDTGVFTELDHLIQAENANVHIAHVGDRINFGDGVQAVVLHPFDGERFKDTNSASVSVLIIYADETFLLTGDLPSTKEGSLISSGYLPRHITVYKAGHHGSKYSSGVQLLTYIKPEYAVISAGKNNKYGHPNSETLDRLTRYARETLSTIDRGTILFITDGKHIEVETQK